MVAAVLGITVQPGMNVSESVASALDGRVRLLVFDNCEHVLDAAADLVEAILTASSTVQILATSREGLGVTEEQVWPLRSLDIDSAVDLFIERARSVAPTFSADEPEAVEEICRRLDRIPLAIELAASRMASMTATEVRDRLGQRFKLLVGSRRGMERHQTLRHAVAWSYELLEGAEKSLLNRCSVFAGGFDLDSACAVAQLADDEYAVLGRLDTLVRKSLLIADRVGGRTRYSMLETIRQFAEDHLVESDAADEVRAIHARYFAGREDFVMTLWDGPRQREAYEWILTELGNMRTAFRWAADHDDIDTAATIATFVGLVGTLAENYEPSTWAEELIENARAVAHPRLAYLLQVASLCYQTGRTEQGLAYTEEIPKAKRPACVDIPFGLDGLAGGAYIMIGQPERYLEWCCEFVEGGKDTHGFTRSAMVNALVFAGRAEEAITAADGLVEAAEATANPWALSYALLSTAWAYRDADPLRALYTARRGLVTTRETGNRFNESHMAAILASLEVDHGDPLAALDHITLALRNYLNAGSVAFPHSPLITLATILERVGQLAAAAVVSSFAALNPMATVANPQISTTVARIREHLDLQTYEALVTKGETMTPSAMVTYAYDQIDRARAELERAT
ncbi:adenylate/guanylate cyclase domain-containing protein [Mycobacterium sp. E136]|uniref:ATP-binding protein n=1 Tax=Mycobacterium sp. E136 TaxID=1834125 RepID=UPI00336BC436